MAYAQSMPPIFVTFPDLLAERRDIDITLINRLLSAALNADKHLLSLCLDDLGAWPPQAFAGYILTYPVIYWPSAQNATLTDVQLIVCKISRASPPSTLLQFTYPPHLADRVISRIQSLCDFLMAQSQSQIHHNTITRTYNSVSI